MALTNWAGAALNAVALQGAQLPWSQTWFGLSQGDPSVLGVFTLEVTAGDYQRKLVTWVPHSTLPKFSVSAVEVLFVPSSAWGTCTYAFLASAATGGSMIAYGTIGSRLLNASNGLRFAAGSLSFNSN